MIYLPLKVIFTRPCGLGEYIVRSKVGKGGIINTHVKKEGHPEHCKYFGTNAMWIKFFRSQTYNCIKGTDWLKRWVDTQHNIYVEKCFVIGQ